MSDFPYETRLNVLHGPLEVVDVQQLADECTYKCVHRTRASERTVILMVETVAIVPTGD